MHDMWNWSALIAAVATTADDADYSDFIRNKLVAKNVKRFA